MKPKVYNKHHRNAPADAVYIGRGSIWGNPYTHRQGTKALYIVATREEAIRAYESSLTEASKAYIKAHLRGRNLVCFCAPLPCHGDVLLRIANEDIQ